MNKAIFFPSCLSYDDSSTAMPVFSGTGKSSAFSTKSPISHFA